MLKVRGDSIAALTALGSLRSKGFCLPFLAREFAFDLGSALYKPDVLTHTPGIANDVPDLLSRRWETAPPTAVPGELLTVHVQPPARDKRWYVQSRRRAAHRR